MKNTSFKDIQLSPHFRLSEFLNLGKYPDNIPTMQAMVNMTYGCLTLLEPARQLVGPIIINSGYRSEEVNSRVGGVKNSQHLTGQAADIRPRDSAQFHRLVDFLKQSPTPTSSSPQAPGSTSLGHPLPSHATTSESGTTDDLAFHPFLYFFALRRCSGAGGGLRRRYFRSKKLK